MAKFYPGEHPAKMQTKEGWKRLGWVVKPDAAPNGHLLRTRYSKARYDLYDFEAASPMKGQKAAARRVEFMLAYLESVAKAEGEKWATGRRAVTDEMIQDQSEAYARRAGQAETLTNQGVFFVGAIAEIGPQRLIDRVAWQFEIGALDGLGRTYESYAYNQW